MAAFIERAGPVQMRAPQGDPFAALLRAIVYQQLAGNAANAIHQRVLAAVGTPLSAEAVLAVPEETMRGAGLSANKYLSIRDLASRVVAGEVDLAHLETLDDEEIITQLSVVRGIGRWTAEMFLLFELRRPDVWPVGDLGVRNGYALIFGLPQMPSPRELEPLGDPFRPYRSVAAWYCWEAVHLARAVP